MIEHLMQAGQIGNMKLKNRIIYSSMSFHLPHHNGLLTQAEIDSLAYRAKQEYSPGLISFPTIDSRPLSPNSEVCIIQPGLRLSLSPTQRTLALKTQLVLCFHLDVCL